MSWGVAILFAIVALIGRLVKGRWNNLLSIFSGFYALTISLASFRLWKINAASPLACTILAIGIIGYAAGYLTTIVVYQRRNALYKTSYLGEHTSTGQTYTARKITIYLMLFIVVLFTLYSSVRALLLLLSGTSFSLLRSLYFGGDAAVGRSKFDLFVYLPLMQSLVLLSCVVLFSNSPNFTAKSKTRIVILVLACEVLSMFTNGGRENIVYMILTILFAYSISSVRSGHLDGRLKQIWKKRKKLFISIFCLCVVAVVIMTMSRSKTGETSFAYLRRTTYFYLSGWLPNFSLRLELLDNESFAHGYAFILGLVRLPAAVIHRLGVPDSQAYRIAEGITSSLQRRMDIGGGRTFNAYVSLFYYFYRDFGIISVLVESFLFGMFCSHREKKFEINRNEKNMFWYLFAFFLIISSMVRWEMVHIKTAMIVYYSVLFFKKKQIEKHSNDIVA